MRYLGATKKQRAYAMGVLDNHKSRRQVALQAGYSNTMANNPKQIENTSGFKLVMAQQAYQAGNLVSGMMNELEARGFKDYDTNQLLKGLDTISKVFERFKPKEASQSDGDVSRIFAGVVGTDSQTLENEITEQSSDDLTSIVNDSIVHDEASQVVDHEKGEQSSEPLTEESSDGIEHSIADHISSDVSSELTS